MRKIPLLQVLPGLGLIAFALAGLTACGSLDVAYNGASYEPSARVDVYTNILTVGRSHRNMGEGRLQVAGGTARGDIRNAFSKTGREQGADGVIILDPADDGGSVGLKDDRTVRGIFIRYSDHDSGGSGGYWNSPPRGGGWGRGS